MIIDKLILKDYSGKGKDLVLTNVDTDGIEAFSAEFRVRYDEVEYVLPYDTERAGVGVASVIHNIDAIHWEIQRNGGYKLVKRTTTSKKEDKPAIDLREIYSNLLSIRDMTYVAEQTGTVSRRLILDCIDRAMSYVKSFMEDE